MDELSQSQCQCERVTFAPARQHYILSTVLSPGQLPSDRDSIKGLRHPIIVNGVQKAC